MNYKFTVCVQPLKGEMISFKSIFGKCEQEQTLKEISAKVYELFGIPICKLHVQRVENKVFLCGLQPLKKEELVQTDLDVISETISQMSTMGDGTVG
jgi:hypothetical protein